MISEELLQSFIAEASDLLDDAESSLVDYSRCESEEEQTEIVNRVFRHFHSIKGSAGFVGLHDIALLTHEAETLLEQYRKTPDRIIPQQDINLLCRTVDLLRAIFATGGERSDEEGNDLGLDSLIQEIKTATKTAKTSAAAAQSGPLSESFPPPADDAQEPKDNGVTEEEDSPSPSNEALKEPWRSSSPDETQTMDKKTVDTALTEQLAKTITDTSVEIQVDDAVTMESGNSVTSDANPGTPENRPLPASDAGTGKIDKIGDQSKARKVDNAAKKTTKANHTSTRRISSDTARIIKMNQATKSDKLQANDFAERYVTEANELLEQIEQSLLHAEQHPEANADSVQEALRCLHSFKGNSGFMNLTDLERLSHRMESEVENHIDRTLGLDSQTFDALLQMIDVLRQGVHDFSIGGSGRIPEADAYIEMMDEFSSDRFNTRYQRSSTTNVSSAASGPPASGSDDSSPKNEEADSNTTNADDSTSQSASKGTRIVNRPRPASDTTRMVLMGNATPQVNLADTPRSGTIVMGDNNSKPAQKAPESVPEKQSKPKTGLKPKPASDTTQKRRNPDQLAARNDIRVDLRKLDSILDLVGELVIAEAMVTRHPVVWNAENESLERAVHQLRRVASSLQDMATSVRMIPLAPTFRRMTRLVYDLSVKAGKQVDLILLGEDTEVDRTVIERISDPLVHIIRNSIDHGIESPEERRRLGKPETGRLTIEGHHEGGEVWIIVTDDGCGFNREAIISRAKSRGLMQGDGSDLTDREIYHFVFEPGFSTANRVTDISGRGFGMDVVKKNIEKLSGRIDIQTRPGGGTAVVMRIPLTLAIIDGMLVSSGENRYIIPLLSIRESLRPEADQIVTTPDGQDVLKLRGELIPIVKLGETFSRSSNAKTLYDGILMIVEGEDDDVVALFADALIGQQETVIKGLSGWLKKSRGVSGCAILGDGEVGLILDIGAIVRMARENPGEAVIPEATQ